MKRSVVTIQDVARKSGYSTATVSRVLNNPAVVSDGVRAAVEEVANELGYIGNNAARALRQQRTRQLGAIIPTLKYAIYAGFVEALQKRCMRDGYTLVLTTSDYSLDNEAEQGINLVRSGVEGLVLVGNLRRSRLQKLLDSAQVPTVNTYVYDPACQSSTIGIDNHLVFRSSVGFLHELGHRDFGMIAGLNRDNDRVTTRVAGFQQGLAAFDLGAEASRIVKESYTIEDGRRGLQRLLSCHSPTAIVCGSDMLAVGASLECQAMGLRVPEDISIMGLDNLDFGSLVVPSLTTIRVPSTDMGDRAADYLLARSNGARETVHIKFDAELIVRGSTGPAPRAEARKKLRRKSAPATD